MTIDLMPPTRVLLWVLSLLPLCACAAVASRQGSAPEEATPARIQAYFQGTHRKVLTFLGYSGAGYEHPEAMIAQAVRTLDEFDPKSTIVNIGATVEGIGAVYEVAKRKGFTTTGIVSTQARDHHVALSPHVDKIFYVQDDTWGGLVAGSDRLSPTSTAMVESSDVLVAIGGGEVARDELAAARQRGKDVRVFAADMRHETARAKARKKGQPEPSDFSGSVPTQGR